MKQKLKSVGRPKLPKGTGKNKFLAFRVSASEFTRVEAAARVAGKPVSRWMREVVMAAL